MLIKIAYNDNRFLKHAQSPRSSLIYSTHRVTFLQCVNHSSAPAPAPAPAPAHATAATLLLLLTLCQSRSWIMIQTQRLNQIFSAIRHDEKWCPTLCRRPLGRSQNLSHKSGLCCTVHRRRVIYLIRLLPLLILHPCGHPPSRKSELGGRSLR
jgi:hypothetical protein